MNTSLNPQLLNIIEAFDRNWNNDDEKTKVLLTLKQYVLESSDFNQELFDLIEIGNTGEGEEEDWFYSIIEALRYHPQEYKTYLLSVYQYIVKRALKNNEHDVFIYFLVNDYELKSFIEKVPETASEIMSGLSKLIQVNDYLFKKVAIQTAEYCLLVDPNADKNNFIVHLGNCLHDADWRVRHQAYNCLKNINALPDGYKKPFLDNMRALLFNKKL